MLQQQFQTQVNILLIPRESLQVLLRSFNLVKGVGAARKRYQELLPVSLPFNKNGIVAAGIFKLWLCLFPRYDYYVKQHARN